MRNIVAQSARFFAVALLVLCAVCATLPAKASTIYDGQAPMTEQELHTFMKLLPQFRAWAASSKAEAHPSLTDGKADFVYSEEAAAWVKTRGWEPKRFFAVMGKAAAALFLVAEGRPAHDTRPNDMPNVTEEELKLVNRFLPQLLEAGSDAPPIE